MASFSSIGIGLGGNVDVNALIKASVDAVKLPITKTNGLSQQVALTNAKVSAFGQFKSLVSTLADAASKLGSVTGWNGVKAATSKAEAVTVTATAGAAATDFNVQVQALAKAQSSVSAAITPTKQAIGAGTLTLAVGSWDAAGTNFTAGTAKAVDIVVSDTDTLADIASKINGAKAGVTATVMTDASGERLMLRSSTTGEVAGYQMSVDEGSNPAGLSRLVTGATTDYAQNAKATVNGIDVVSATNAFADTVAGVNFTALQVTTDPVSISVTKDYSSVKTNVEAFVKAYNALNQALNDVTKYDKDTKTAGLLQGDSSAVTLQNTLRMALQSVNGSGEMRNLSAIGVVSDPGTGLSPSGDLKLDSNLFAKAMENPDEMKAFFRGPEGGSTAEGFSGKFQAVTSKLLASDGFFASKTKSYDQALKLTAKEVANVNDRADRLEKSMTARFALDTKMASLTALNAYISQQVTTWNKSS